MSPGLISVVAQCRDTENEIMDFSVGSNAKEQQRANLFALKNYCNAPSSCFAQAGDRGGVRQGEQLKQKVQNNAEVVLAHL